MATIKQDDLFTHKMTCIEETVTLRTKKIITDTSTDITNRFRFMVFNATDIIISLSQKHQKKLMVFMRDQNK
jgi:hypothetical protein